MKIYEFGENGKQSLMLLPDALCHIKNSFGSFIENAIKCYHIYAVSYTGMENDGEIFISLQDEAEKIEKYIISSLDGKIDAIYGSGMGGLIGSLIVSREKVAIGHLVISGTTFSTSPTFLAKISANRRADDAMKVFSENTAPSKIKKYMKSSDTEEYANLVEAFYSPDREKMTYIKRETAFNMFYSQSITKFPENVLTDTKVHVFYYTRMGDVYEEKYTKHFLNLDIRGFEMMFDELMMKYPKQFLIILRSCTGQFAKKING